MSGEDSDHAHAVRDRRASTGAILWDGLLGKRLTSFWFEDGWFDGTITAYVPENKEYPFVIEYDEDGDQERARFEDDLQMLTACGMDEEDPAVTMRPVKWPESMPILSRGNACAHGASKASKPCAASGQIQQPSPVEKRDRPCKEDMEQLGKQEQVLQAGLAVSPSYSLRAASGAQPKYQHGRTPEQARLSQPLAGKQVVTAAGCDRKKVIMLQHEAAHTTFKPGSEVDRSSRAPAVPGTGKVRNLTKPTQLLKLAHAPAAAGTMGRIQPDRRQQSHLPFPKRGTTGSGQQQQQQQQPTQEHSTPPADLDVGASPAEACASAASLPASHGSPASPVAKIWGQGLTLQLQLAAAGLLSSSPPQASEADLEAPDLDPMDSKMLTPVQTTATLAAATAQATPSSSKIRSTAISSLPAKAPQPDPLCIQELDACLESMTRAAATIKAAASKACECGKEAGVGPARVMRVVLRRQEYMAEQLRNLQATAGGSNALEARVVGLLERRLCVFYFVDSVLQRVAKEDADQHRLWSSVVLSALGTLIKGSVIHISYLQKVKRIFEGWEAKHILEEGPMRLVWEAYKEEEGRLGGRAGAPEGVGAAASHPIVEQQNGQGRLEQQQQQLRGPRVHLPLPSYRTARDGEPSPDGAIASMMRVLALIGNPYGSFDSGSALALPAALDASDPMPGAAGTAWMAAFDRAPRFVGPRDDELDHSEAWGETGRMYGTWREVLISRGRETECELHSACTTPGGPPGSAAASMRNRSAEEAAAVMMMVGSWGQRPSLPAQRMLDLGLPLCMASVPLPFDNRLTPIDIMDMASAPVVCSVASPKELLLPQLPWQIDLEEQVLVTEQDTFSYSEALASEQPGGDGGRGAPPSLDPEEELMFAPGAPRHDERGSMYGDDTEEEYGPSPVETSPAWLPFNQASVRGPRQPFPSFNAGQGQQKGSSAFPPGFAPMPSAAREEWKGLMPKKEAAPEQHSNGHVQEGQSQPKAGQGTHWDSGRAAVSAASLLPSQAPYLLPAAQHRNGATPLPPPPLRLGCSDGQQQQQQLPLPSPPPLLPPPPPLLPPPLLLPSHRGSLPGPALLPACNSPSGPSPLALAWNEEIRNGVMLANPDAHPLPPHLSLPQTSLPSTAPLGTLGEPLWISSRALDRADLPQKEVRLGGRISGLGSRQDSGDLDAGFAARREPSQAPGAREPHILVKRLYTSLPPEPPAAPKRRGEWSAGDGTEWETATGPQQPWLPDSGQQRGPRSSGSPARDDPTPSIPHEASDELGLLIRGKRAERRSSASPSDDGSGGSGRRMSPKRGAGGGSRERMCLSAGERGKSSNSSKSHKKHKKERRESSETCRKERQRRDGLRRASGAGLQDEKEVCIQGGLGDGLPCQRISDKDEQLELVLVDGRACSLPDREGRPGADRNDLLGRTASGLRGSASPDLPDAPRCVPDCAPQPDAAVLPRLSTPTELSVRQLQQGRTGDLLRHVEKEEALHRRCSSSCLDWRASESRSQEVKHAGALPTPHLAVLSAPGLREGRARSPQRSQSPRKEGRHEQQGPPSGSARLPGPPRLPGVDAGRRQMPLPQPPPRYNGDGRQGAFHDRGTSLHAGPRDALPFRGGLSANRGARDDSRREDERDGRPPSVVRGDRVDVRLGADRMQPQRRWEEERLGRRGNGFQHNDVPGRGWGSGDRQQRWEEGRHADDDGTQQRLHQQPAGHGIPREGMARGPQGWEREHSLGAAVGGRVRRDSPAGAPRGEKEWRGSGDQVSQRRQQADPSDSFRDNRHGRKPSEASGGHEEERPGHSRRTAASDRHAEERPGRSQRTDSSGGHKEERHGGCQQTDSADAPEEQRPGCSQQPDPSGGQEEERPTRRQRTDSTDALEEERPGRRQRACSTDVYEEERPGRSQQADPSGGYEKERYGRGQRTAVSDRHKGERPGSSQRTDSSGGHEEKRHGRSQQAGSSDVLEVERPGCSQQDDPLEGREERPGRRQTFKAFSDARVPLQKALPPSLPPGPPPGRERARLPVLARLTWVEEEARSASEPSPDGEPARLPLRQQEPEWRPLSACDEDPHISWFPVDFARGAVPGQLTSSDSLDRFPAVLHSLQEAAVEQLGRSGSGSGLDSSGRQEPRGYQAGAQESPSVRQRALVRAPLTLPNRRSGTGRLGSDIQQSSAAPRQERGRLGLCSAERQADGHRAGRENCLSSVQQQQQQQPDTAGHKVQTGPYQTEQLQLPSREGDATEAAAAGLPNATRKRRPPILFTLPSKAMEGDKPSLAKLGSVDACDPGLPAPPRPQRAPIMMNARASPKCGAPKSVPVAPLASRDSGGSRIVVPPSLKGRLSILMQSKDPAEGS